MEGSWHLASGQDHPLGKAFVAYAKINGMDATQLIFEFDGQQLKGMVSIIHAIAFTCR